MTTPTFPEPDRTVVHAPPNPGASITMCCGASTYSHTYSTDDAKITCPVWRAEHPLPEGDQAAVERAARAIADQFGGWPDAETWPAWTEPMLEVRRHAFRQAAEHALATARAGGDGEARVPGPGEPDALYLLRGHVKDAEEADQAAWKRGGDGGRAAATLAAYRRALHIVETSPAPAPVAVTREALAKIIRDADSQRRWPLSLSGYLHHADAVLAALGAPTTDEEAS